MILETLLTEKPCVTFSKILRLIFSTLHRSSTQGVNFVTFVCLSYSVTTVTYVHFRHCPESRSYSRYNFFAEMEFPLNMILSGYKLSNTKTL